MKIMIKLLLMAMTAFGLCYVPTYAQPSKQDTLTTKRPQATRGSADTDNPAYKAMMLREIKKLTDSENEANHILAARLYRNMGDEKTAEKITEGLAKKFPRGVSARDAEMHKIFNKKSLDRKNSAYRSWLKKFPPSSFNAKEQQIYTIAAFQIGRDMIIENRNEEALALINENAETPRYYEIITAIVNDLNRSENYALLLPLLRDAAQSIEKEENQDQIHDDILGQYAQILVHSGNATDGVEIIKSVINRAGTRIKHADVQVLATGYEALGRDLDAFYTLERFLTHNSMNMEVVADLERLYNKLNTNNGNFIAYRNGLDFKIKNAKKEKYKGEMIEKKAPAFTLINMQGETVRLSDYLGKIVILDFWATWCGPCIMSFPGMQAAVNKYQNDPEVEFLFINTSQREPNYKELVTDFIAKHGYNFHVVYDEMIDLDKATVATYGIKGIPTKVFIDQKGNIRFQSTGGSADVAVVVGEMDAKIELIKEAKNLI